ncbi:MAG: NapC/NirT family cytochrome c [Ornithinibacter sp.]
MSTSGDDPGILGRDPVPEGGSAVPEGDGGTAVPEGDGGSAVPEGSSAVPGRTGTVVPTGDGDAVPVGDGAAASVAEPAVGFWARWKARLLRVLPKTPRGILGFVGGVLLLGVLGTVGGVHLVEYSESAAFCTTCHTMTPQQKAFEAGPHQDVGCGECHVDPGVVGFVKAKLAGTKELYALVTRTYPTPIPPIEHEKLPPTSHTCEKCHPLSLLAQPGQPSKLHVRASFERDEKNTRNDLAVLIRPANADGAEPVSTHWHVLQDVSYTSPDEHQRVIDSVQFKDDKTGEVEQFIAEGQVRESINAGQDLARLKASQPTRTMDCLDCHNRVGHDSPTADRAVDAAMAEGRISPTLPFVKRNSVALLTNRYATDEEGREAIRKLSDFYATKYPLVAKDQANDITAATKSLTEIFDHTVDSHMDVRSGTYPTNLGHQSSNGCFRCHDGAHYKVVKGQLTKETIPSTCETCHTAPQGSQTVANVPLGTRPTDHTDPLWVFDHKIVAGTTTANPATCGVCHQTSYCENCHKSGAIKVSHAEMLYNHAQSAKVAGGTQACAVCHQKAYCEECHKDNVLPRSNAHLPSGGS